MAFAFSLVLVDLHYCDCFEAGCLSDAIWFVPTILPLDCFPFMYCTTKGFWYMPINLTTRLFATGLFFFTLLLCFAILPINDFMNSTDHI